MGERETSPERRTSPCPVCGKPAPRPVAGATAESPFPFCTRRCRTIDLGNWLDERYRVDEVSSDEPSYLPSED
jgi:hypothetical protein